MQYNLYYTECACNRLLTVSTCLFKSVTLVIFVCIHRYTEVLQVYEDMRNAKLSPDTTALTTVIEACHKLGNTQKAAEFEQQLQALQAAEHDSSSSSSDPAFAAVNDRS